MLEYVNCFKSDAIMNVNHVFDDSLPKMLDDERFSSRYTKKHLKLFLNAKWTT
jgi:hypothetical protein